MKVSKSWGIEVHHRDAAKVLGDRTSLSFSIQDHARPQPSQIAQATLTYVDYPPETPRNPRPLQTKRESPYKILTQPRGQEAHADTLFTALE